MPNSTRFYLKKAGLLPEKLLSLATLASQAKPIADDVWQILSDAQQETIISNRYKLCSEFQEHLELFWKANYGHMTNFGKQADAHLRAYLDAPADQKPPTTAEMRALQTADFNISHEGNRNLALLKRFLDRRGKKEPETENERKYAKTTVSSMPSTFYTAYEVYVGNTPINVRPFFSQEIFE